MKKTRPIDRAYVMEPDAVPPLWIEKPTVLDKGVVAILGRKGGIGKTSLARDLAQYNAVLGKSVLTIDMDPQCNLSTNMMGTPEWATHCGLTDFGASRGRSKPTVESVFLDPNYRSKPERIVLPVVKYEVGKVDLLPGSWDLGSMFMRDATKMHLLKDAVGLLRGHYDVIILDLPPVDTPSSRSALLASDVVVVPTQLEPWPTNGLFPLNKTLYDLSMDRKEGVVPVACVVVIDIGPTISKKARAQYWDDLDRTCTRLKWTLLRYCIPRAVQIGRASCGTKGWCYFNVPRARKTRTAEVSRVLSEICVATNWRRKEV